MPGIDGWSRLSFASIASKKRGPPVSARILIFLSCDDGPGGGAVGGPSVNAEAAVWADRVLVALADLAGEVTDTKLIEQVAVRFADRFGPSDRVYAANADCPRWHEAVREALRSLVAQGLVQDGDSPALSPTGRDHLDAARASTAEATTGAGGQAGGRSSDERPLLLSGVIAPPLRSDA